MTWFWHRLRVRILRWMEMVVDYPEMEDDDEA